MCLPGQSLKLDEHPKLMALICTAIGISGIGLILTIAFNDQDTMLGVGIALGVFGVAATILGCIHLQSSSALSEMKKNDDFMGAENVAAKSIAPNKIPSPFDVSKGKIRGVDDDASPSPTRIPPPVDDDKQATQEDLGIVGETRWAGVQGSPARGIIPDGASSRGPSAGGQNGLIYSDSKPARGDRDSPAPRGGGSSNGSASGGGGGGGGLVLSPFGQRSYPVPTSLFPAPSPVPGSARPRPSATAVDTGISGGNGYDAQSTAQVVRSNQDSMDAVRAAGMQDQAPVGLEEDDEDALPRGYWNDRR